MKYTISFETEFGQISAESSKFEDMLGAYGRLRTLAKELKKSKGTLRPTPPPRIRPRLKSRIAKSRKGGAETAVILREIQNRLLSSDFFLDPKTTGETRDELRGVSKRSFTSRKVSQALGILWRKHLLKRSGTRNYYSYSK